MYHTELQGRDVGCGALTGCRTGRSSPPLGSRLPGAPCRLMHNRAVPGSSSNTSSNGFCSCSCTRPHKKGMDISELEFVQIIIILLVMTFMIVVIICLLNHYWLPALAFLSRLSHTHRDQTCQSRPPQLDGSVWSGSALTRQRSGEVMCGHLNSSLPPFMQQQQRCRFQPTYPYLQQEIINLPPIICLSDGEELLPYKGPCSLQLRHPEQQLELSRAAVRPPPNRTVFEGELIDIYIRSKRLQVPSSNSGSDDASAGMEDPPPSYSEVMGDYSQYSNNACPQATG